MFNLRYEGDVEDVSRPFKCEIEVDVVDDWTSLGSEITYAAYEGPFGDNEFYDHYRRGIMVQFFPAGHVYKTDPYTLIMTIIAGLVMLGVANFLTGLVAFYCLKESSMYSAATYETFNPARRLAKFGLNAAMVCQLFNMLNVESDNEISEKELQQAFKGNFSEEEEVVCLVRNYIPHLTIPNLTTTLLQETISFEDYMKAQQDKSKVGPVLEERKVEKLDEGFVRSRDGGDGGDDRMYGMAFHEYSGKNKQIEQKEARDGWVNADSVFNLKFVDPNSGGGKGDRDDRRGKGGKKGGKGRDESRGGRGGSRQSRPQGKIELDDTSAFPSLG